VKNPNFIQLMPRVPAVIEPPETLDICFIFLSSAVSLRTYERADVEHHRAVSAARESETDSILWLRRISIVELIEGHLRLHW
jgi:hypothetical protein